MFDSVRVLRNFIDGAFRGLQRWCDPTAGPGGARRAAQHTFNTGSVDVSDYDHPTKRISKLTGFARPAGECTDKAGDIFITDPVKDPITEYRHGGTKPIATYEESYPESSTGCGVDPKSGKLAVANNTDNGVSSSGDIAIYTNPSHGPRFTT